MVFSWQTYKQKNTVQSTLHKNIYRDLCNGQDEIFVEVLADYNKASVTFVKRFCIIVRLMIHMWEAIIYMVIFKHIANHDRSMYQYLSSQAIQRRKRNSAISITCHMSMHFVEWLFEVMLLLSKNSVSWNLILTVFQFQFAVKSACQVMSTETSRALCFRIFSRLKSSTLVLWLRSRFARKIQPPDQ